MSTASTFEQGMLALINAERASQGVNPLQLETQLNTSAEDHSTWMLNTDTFSHTGENGSGATDRMEDAGFDFTGSWSSGENIAWQSERGLDGIGDDVEQLHLSLMESPGHRDNILNPDFEYIGIGIEVGDYNGWNAVMVTQNFAVTDAEGKPDTGAASTTPAENTAEIPAQEAPDSDLPETEEPLEGTPETDVTVATIEDRFNVEAFLTTIENFVNDLLVLVDDFRMNVPLATDFTAINQEFMFSWDLSVDAPSAPDVSTVIAATRHDDFFTMMPLDTGQTTEFV